MELHFNEDEIIVSKTDTKGIITYGNQLFIKLSGYAEEELLGKPHNLIRHRDMPKLIFKLLWQRIQAGEEIFAYVINRAKNGDFYWVLANVTPSFGPNGQIVGYYSVRRKPKTQAIQEVKQLYTKLINIENQQGIKECESYFNQLLHSKGLEYDQFVLSL